MGDILASDDQILAGVIDAAQHDVGVGMGGVEVIDRDPVETSAEVGPHLRHQPADIGLEVGIFRAILGRRSEAHTSELQSLIRTSYALLCLTTNKYDNNLD